MKILITSIGKRVELISHLKKNNYIIGVDSNYQNNVAGAFFVDEFYKVNKVDLDNGEEYIKDLINIIRSKKVELIIPLYEPEFFLLESYRNELLKYGAELLLSDKTILQLTMNKYNTQLFFEKYNLPAPRMYFYEKDDEYIFPLILKPVNGMGSRGVYKINNKKELDSHYQNNKNLILQEFIDADEYTIDVMLDFEGEIISIVPRIREVVVSGEVEKSRTISKDTLVGKKLIDATKKLIGCLKENGKIRGPFTLQAFANEKEMYWIEINPRFGGGVTLSINSGIDYAKHISQIKDKYNKEVYIKNMNYKEKRMLRYTQAYYVDL